LVFFYILCLLTQTDMHIIKSLDVTKIKSSSGLTFAQELANAANLLRDCIQERINRDSLGNCISTSDLADIRVDGNRLSVILKVQNYKRPSIFNESNHKFANVFWLLNDGFIVKKDWYFNGFAHKGRWVYRKAEHFVEFGIAEFQRKTKLPVKVQLIKSPDLYYCEE